MQGTCNSGLAGEGCAEHGPRKGEWKDIAAVRSRTGGGVARQGSRGHGEGGNVRQGGCV